MKSKNELNERVYDWMLREHPEEKEFGLPFSKRVTFKEVIDRMESGEDFGRIIDYRESEQRVKIFERLVVLTGKGYDYWYDLWLNNGD